MRISDWSSDVCSSDLFQAAEAVRQIESAPSCRPAPFALGNARQMRQQVQAITETPNLACFVAQQRLCIAACRSEEHTSELQSLMRISYAVFCLKKKKNTKQDKHTHYARQSTYTSRDKQ